MLPEISAKKNEKDKKRAPLILTSEKFKNAANALAKDFDSNEYLPKKKINVRKKYLISENSNKLPKMTKRPNFVSCALS